jgi:hypothetical protein
MGSQPFMLNGKRLEELSDEELELAKEELRQQSTGWDALKALGNATLAQTGIPSIAAAGSELASLSDQERSRLGLVGMVGRGLAAADEAIDSPMRQLRQHGGSILFGQGEAPQMRTIQSRPSIPRTREDAIMAGGGEVAPPGGPVSAQPAAGSEFKTIITSRRGGPGEGPVVFETSRVPIAQQPRAAEPGDYAGPGLGVEEWKARALAENPMRAIRTEQLGSLNPSGARSTGFQVREGSGGFSPSAAIPDVSADFNEVMQTQSPAVQDIWLERRARAMALAREQAGIGELEARSKLLGAQAGQAEAETAGIADPMVAAKRMAAMYDYVSQNIGEQAAGAIQADIQAAVATLKQSGAWSPEIERAAIAAITRKHTGSEAVAQQVRAIMGGVPAVAAAQARTAF